MTAKDTKTLILDATADCFARHGSEHTSIDDIARDLGATKGKIYHHFRSKGELLSAVRKRSVQLTMDNVKPIHAAGGPFSDMFWSMAQAHVLTMLESLSYHRVVVENFRAGNSGSTTHFERELLDEIRDLQATYENMFRDVITAGINDGVFRDQPVSIAVHSLLMLLNAPVYWYSPRDGETDLDRRRIAGQISTLALNALKA